MRLSVRVVPWLLALVGLAIPLVGSGFVLWQLIVVWLVILALIWIVGRHAIPRTKGARVALAIGVLPFLVAAAWEGGWWLIPADLTWLVLELVGKGGATDEPFRPDAIP